MTTPLPSTTVIPRPTFLSRPGLVVTTTLVVIAGLVLLLWRPWETRREDRQPVRFFCAAGMAKPVTELLKEFEELTGIKTEVTYGPSGSLLSSILTAPDQADLYLAADAANMVKAKKEGIIAEEIRLGTQHPVLVTNRATAAEWEKSGKSITRLKDLLRPDVKVMLANTAASIGELSRKILTRHGLWEQLAPQVTAHGTVNEVATAVRASHHSVGIVWNAVAHEFDLVTLPVDELRGHSEPMLLGVLAKTSRSPSALKLARFLQAGDKGAKAFNKHHFESIKDGDPWDPRPVLHIDAGAMLKPVLDPVVRRFEAREGVRIETRYAGCGVLVADMKAVKGAAGSEARNFPDAYFACDVSFLKQVEDWFEARRDISSNDVVMVVGRKNQKEFSGLGDLAKDQWRVGLGDPEKSALGKLTDNILLRLAPLKEAVYDSERTFPVVNLPEGHMLVTQVRTGALDVAVVYRSNVESVPDWAESLAIVRSDRPYDVATQPFAISRGTRHRQLLLRFLNMLASPESVAHFEHSGFQPIK